MNRAAAFIFCLFLSASALAQPLRVAVASNFKDTMDHIAQQYTEQTGTKVRVSAAASGVLYQQIKRNAPFDVFFSADRARPQMLKDEGIATKVVDYAQGRLAMYSQKGELASILSKLDSSCTVAIANPTAAPYGAVAKAYLSEHKTLARCKVIQGANIASAFAYTQMHNVDVGFVAYSHLLEKSISAEHYQLLGADDALWQAYAIIKKPSFHDDLAPFLQFVHSESTQQFIRSKGYIGLP